MAEMLSELGAVAVHQGQPRRAARLHRRARGVFRKTGNRTGEVQALNGLGEALLVMRRPGDARAEFAAALSVTSRIGLRRQQARALRGLGDSCRALGESGTAARYWREALAIRADLGIPFAPVPRTSRARLQARNLASKPAGEIAWSGAGAQR
jgi:tetratricopeptide (TPR) repeat protein